MEKAGGGRLIWETLVRGRLPWSLCQDFEVRLSLDREVECDEREIALQSHIDGVGEGPAAHPRGGDVVGPAVCHCGREEKECKGNASDERPPQRSDSYIIPQPVMFLHRATGVEPLSLGMSTSPDRHGMQLPFVIVLQEDPPRTRGSRRPKTCSNQHGDRSRIVTREDGAANDSDEEEHQPEDGEGNPIGAGGG